MITTAVILAAGLGSRLRPYTDHYPKGFIPVHGQPIVIQSIEKLRKVGMTRIIIGTGYMKAHYERLQLQYPEIECVENLEYDSTGSMATLVCCRELIGDENVLLLESDLVYPQYALEAVLQDVHSTVMLASGETGSGDEVYIEYDTHHILKKLSKNPDDLMQVSAELVGINKISNLVFQEMVQVFYDAKNPTLDYEGTMAMVSAQSGSVYVHKIDDLVWCEVDTEAHLKRAEGLGVV
jgi:2-aminoethylphosphonate-pyruvate transaminase